MQRNPPCLEEARTSTSQGSIRAKVGSHFLGLQSLKKSLWEREDERGEPGREGGAGRGAGKTGKPPSEDGEVKSQAHGFRPCLPFHQAGGWQREAHFFLSEQILSLKSQLRSLQPVQTPKPEKNAPTRPKGCLAAPSPQGPVSAPEEPGSCRVAHLLDIWESPAAEEKEGRSENSPQASPPRAKLAHPQRAQGEPQ